VHGICADRSTVLGRDRLDGLSDVVRHLLPKHVEEALRCAWHESILQCHDGYCPWQRPVFDSESFQSPPTQLVSHDSVGHCRYAQASAYQALDCIGSPHVHGDSWLDTTGIKPLGY